MYRITQILLLFAGIFVAGCTSSASSDGDSSVADSSNATTTDNVSTNAVVNSTVGGDIQAMGDSSMLTGTDISINDNASIDENATDENAANANLATQNATQVEIRITVPAYKSDSLQVSIVWGEQKTNATWVGDELWSAMVFYPSNTEHQLIVTFSDQNGSIALGSFEQVYRTSTNASQSILITADQFNTHMWDTDEDGVSNLDESTTGTDPLKVETEPLEIRDYVNVSDSVFITEAFSRRLSDERPYINQSEVSILPEECEPNCIHYNRNIHNILIDVDEIGNASISDFHERGSVSYPRHVSLEGTRVISADGIDWEGLWIFHSSYRDEFSTTIRFTNTLTAMDETTRNYTGTTRSNSAADYTTDAYTSNYDITGRTIENSTMCEPVAGSIETEYYYRSEHIYSKMITRKLDDSFWTVSIDYIDDMSTTGSDEKYFARSLNISIWQDDAWGKVDYPQFVSEVEGKFKCDVSYL